MSSNKVVHNTAQMCPGCVNPKCQLLSKEYVSEIDDKVVSDTVSKGLLPNLNHFKTAVIIEREILITKQLKFIFKLQIYLSQLLFAYIYFSIMVFNIFRYTIELVKWRSFNFSPKVTYLTQNTIQTINMTKIGKHIFK